MTTPRDDIGLSERLRDPNAAYTKHSDGDPDFARYVRWLKALCQEAAAALDALAVDNDQFRRIALDRLDKLTKAAHALGRIQREGK